MGAPYPPNPVGPLPSVVATRTYKLRVVFVLASLLLFVAVYFGLIALTAWGAYASVFRFGPITFEGRSWMLRGAGGAVCTALFLFLLKGLFHRDNPSTEEFIEITEAEHPRFFAFVRRLCADAGSKLPAKTYLSHDVNAGVFYQRSLLSLVLPAKKNLVVGAGLLTALDVAELKAVLAHEFGHFGQASMKLGQYVYTANAVVRNVVYGRDRWDEAVRTLTRMDYRIAVVAYVIVGLAHCIRKLIELLFKLMNLASFSLGRQMEFDADLMAVRLAGSDAIISGLWKAERGSLALHHAALGLKSLAQHGTFSRNVFFHQARSLSRIEGLIRRERGAAEELAHVLRPYARGPTLHYASAEKAVGELWATHPPKHEREANAKTLYVPSPLEPAPAWGLLDDRRNLRERLSRIFYRDLGFEPTTFSEPVDVEASIEDESGEMRQGPQYHGLYEARLVSIANLEQLIDVGEREAGAASSSLEDLRARASDLVGSELERIMDRRRELEEADEIIRALATKGSQLRGKTAKVLGRERTREEIIELGPVVAPELEGIDARLSALDQAVFAYFYARTVNDPQAREELLERYRFLNVVQGLLAPLRAVAPVFGQALERLGQQQELYETELRWYWEMFMGVWGSLVRVGNTLTGTRAPRLELLERDARLDQFVLPTGLVPPLVTGAIPGPWLAALIRQFTVATGRLGKLRAKNLGALLALEERIDPALFPALSGPASIRPEAPDGADD